jgi:hypothetical protein
MGRQLEEINFNLIHFLQTIEIIFLVDNNQKPIDNIPYPYISSELKLCISAEEG